MSIRSGRASPIQPRSSGLSHAKEVSLPFTRSHGMPRLTGLSGAIVVLTGEHDYITDGEVVIKASNGHSLVSPASSAGYDGFANGPAW